jgi:hypothetical protein
VSAPRVSPPHPLTALSALALLTACDFVNSATELTFGEGQVPLVAQSMQYPSVESLTGLNEAGESIPGVPTDLSQSTMAHLVGALGARGECAQVVELSGLASNITRAAFELSACAEDDRCARACPGDFYGLDARVALEMRVLNAAQAKKITALLSKDSAEAITQIRLQFQELVFFEGEGEARVSTNGSITDFELWLGAPGVEPTRLLDAQDFNHISASNAEGKSERYEIPRDSAVARALIDRILSGEDVDLSIDLRFRIPRGELYSLGLSPAGVSQVIQPEIVIDAIEAATSTL